MIASNLPHNIDAVNALQNAFRITSPKARCQCGKWCPLADACLPIAGEVHQPYISVMEKTSPTSPTGTAWAAFSFDPQEQKLYRLSNRWHDTPCAASQAALFWSMDTRQPLRLELVSEHSEATRIDWVQMEAKLATDLHNEGYSDYIDRQGQLRPAPNMAHPRMMAHPVWQLGWDAAHADTERVFAEAEAQLSTAPGLAWEDAPFLVEAQ